MKEASESWLLAAPVVDELYLHRLLWDDGEKGLGDACSEPTEKFVCGCQLTTIVNEKLFDLLVGPKSSSKLDN